MKAPRRKKIHHRGKAIILHDYTGLANQEYVDAILENSKLAETEDYPVELILVDATDTVVNKDVIKAYKHISKNASARISKSAVIGATEIQKLFITTVSAFSKMDIRAFESKDDALEWLVS
jgi:hypothetical protein